ncbi:S-layer homology domain-containing protein [Flavonifractor sp. An91]|uniref:S-layer homology domain-containing protein n=1 Tax=Flavonifractor sp. An91 TaxID=1965665 RepID=UPI0013A642F9|nr:S-layer homology domain-containing protein [Flavonifractor sp. An91]
MKRKMWKRLASMALATVLTVGLIPGAQAAADYSGAVLEIEGSATGANGQYDVSYSASLKILNETSEIVALVNTARVNENWLESLRFTCYLEDALLKDALMESDLEGVSLEITGTNNYEAVSTNPVKTENGVSATYQLTDAAVDELSASTLSAQEVAAILAENMNIAFTGTLTNSEVWNAVGGASTITTTGYVLVTYDGTMANDNGFNVDVSKRLAEDTCTTTISPTASGGGSSRPTYPVEAVDTPNGEVKATPTRASKGTLVTITVTPDTGYEVASLSVVDEDGNEVEVEDKGNGKYTFTMPASEVSVNVTFAEIVDDMPFVDVAENDWFYDSVRYVYDNGLMEGTSATTFAPTLTTTRSMVTTILWRAEGQPQTDNTVSYPDVEADTWYTEAICWGTEEGIVKGYGDGNFGPNDLITREQFATILYRYAQYKGYDVSASDDLSAFPDADQTGSWAVDAVKWAVGSGLLNGKDGGLLDPLGVASRAEVATILMRFMENIAE